MRIVGLNISVSPQSLHVDQNQFVRDLARRFGQLNCNPVHTPSTLGDVPEGSSPFLPPGHDYLSLVGSLLWVTISRPHITVAVSKACAKSVRPTKADRAAAILVLRYLLTKPTHHVPQELPSTHRRNDICGCSLVKRSALAIKVWLHGLRS